MCSSKALETWRCSRQVMELPVPPSLNDACSAVVKDSSSIKVPGRVLLKGVGSAALAVLFA